MTTTINKTKFDNHSLWQHRAMWIAIGAIAMALRFTPNWMAIESADYTLFLNRWVTTLRILGVDAFKYAFADYSPPYTYFLYIISLIPGSPLVWIKLLSIIFDIVCAVSIYHIMHQLIASPRQEWMPYAASALFLCIPQGLINSAVWGQCDAIYTSFLLLSFLNLLKRRPLWAIFWISISIAFKFQGILLLPVFCVLWYRHEMRWWWFALIPVIYLLCCTPCFIAGRSLGAILHIYGYQIHGSGPILYLSLPNIYFGSFNLHATRLVYDGIIAILGIATFAGAWWLSRARINDDVERKRYLLAIAYLTLTIYPFVLPYMHERYLYPADALALPFILTFGTAKQRHSNVAIAAAVLQILVSALSVDGYLPHAVETLLNSVAEDAYMSVVPYIIRLMYATSVALLLWFVLSKMWKTSRDFKGSE